MVFLPLTQCLQKERVEILLLVILSTGHEIKLSFGGVAMENKISDRQDNDFTYNTTYTSGIHLLIILLKFSLYKIYKI